MFFAAAAADIVAVLVVADPRVRCAAAVAGVVTAEDETSVIFTSVSVIAAIAYPVRFF